MKTKYSQLLKIKKQKVDALENMLAILNAQKNELKNEIESLSNNIDKMQKPSEGTYGELSAFRYRFDKLMQIKRAKKHSLFEKESQIENIKIEYKGAMIEYEKIKYLEDVLMQERIKKIQKSERDFMDDISVMRYKRREM